VEARLIVLRAGEVLKEPVPLRPCQSIVGVQTPCPICGLMEHLAGEDWLSSEGVDRHASGRSNEGGFRFQAYKEEGDEALRAPPAYDLN